MKLLKDKKRIKRICSKSVKIAVGSGLAIMLANLLNLKYDIFAGTITLLTILTTRWETIRLSLYRVVTFLFSVVVCFLVFNHLGGGWLEYGIFVLIMVLFCEALGWGATISVNAVVGAHFFTEADFSLSFIVNEFLLLLIGIVIAVVLSFFSNNRGTQKRVLQDMQYVEEQLKGILAHMADYLRKEGYAVIKRNWRDRRGEIDVIAESDTHILFVEVKTRKENALVGGIAAVNRSKALRIKLAAASFLNRLNRPLTPRFDVAEITVYTRTDGSRGYRLNYIKSAF